MNIQIDLNKGSNAQKVFMYSKVRNRLLNIQAIFSDETHNFRSPVEPKKDETVSLRIRTAKNNVDQVFVHYEEHKVEMKISNSDSRFDYYEVEIEKIGAKVSYYFEIVLNNASYYYNKKGVSKDIDEAYHFRIIPDFHTPNWAKGAVMYQIFVDRFYNGDPNNDVVNNEYIYEGKPSQKIKDWNKYPASDGIREFYGGDIKGVIDKMGYLKDLGVEAIYFNPIFVSPSNHKYDTQDYDSVDPHLGVIIEDGGEVLKDGKFHNKYATMYIQRTTNHKNLEASNALMIDLIRIAHENGIKVILDGVFNHCGSFNKWMDREKFYEGQKGYAPGAYKHKDSPYHHYFHWYEQDNWPNNDGYDGWWGYHTLPKLNYEGSKELYQFILDVGRKWVSPPYNADGWRLDVAADLGYSKEFNHQFWRDFRKAVKEANPEAIVLAEHYGDAYDWLQGDQWDTVMNYDAFMEPITWFLTGLEKHSDDYRGDLLGNGNAFRDAMTYHMARHTVQSLQVCMNQLSNHDHSRFMTRTNKTVGRTYSKGPEAAAEGINKGIMKEAVLMQMTWPGAPTIYYGDEAGQVGWTDPDNRRTYPWDREDKELVEFHKEVIKIRKSYEALRTGSLLLLNVEDFVLSYGRWDEKEKLIVIVNNDESSREIHVPVWQIGIGEENKLIQILFSTFESWSVEGNEYDVKNGHIQMELPPFSGMILKEK